ncbi:DedA family protein [Candidatus Parcubacteria bacterium]|nr:MAG: DedA family protein [Candidatus Parcubacteria bacterium]
MNKRDVFYLVLTVIVIGVFASSLYLQTVVYKYVDVLVRYMETYRIFGIAIVVFGATLSSMLAPFTIAPILLPPAIVTHGAFITFLYFLSGWVLGGIISFYISRLWGRPALERLRLAHKVDYYEKLVPREHHFFVLLLFRLAMPSEIPGYILGLTNIGFLRYFWATLLAEIPIGLILVYAGGAFVEKEFITLAVLVGLAVFITVTTFLIFIHRTKRQN